MPLTGTMPQIVGVHHIALTVTDLESSAAFYERLLDSSPTGRIDDEALHRVLFTLPNGMNLGLTQHDTPSANSFSPFDPGLDHIGFAVEDRAELDSWVKHLTNIEIAHSGVVEASYGSALSVQDPDGIALEFFVSVERREHLSTP